MGAAGGVVVPTGAGAGTPPGGADGAMRDRWAAACMSLSQALVYIMVDIRHRKMA